MTAEFAVLRYIEFVHNRASLSPRSYVEYRIDAQTLAEGICYRNLKLINIRFRNNTALKYFSSYIDLRMQRVKISQREYYCQLTENHINLLHHRLLLLLKKNHLCCLLNF